jgi:hypothetical protein
MAVDCLRRDTANGLYQRRIEFVCNFDIARRARVKAIVKVNVTIEACPLIDNLYRRSSRVFG